MRPLGLVLALLFAAVVARAGDAPRDAWAEASEALTDAPGLFIGEIHEENHPAYLFVLRHMGDFQVRGVRLLGLEMVNAVDQAAIDAYYAYPEKNAAALKEVLTRRWGSPYRFELIEKARSLGIRTVAVDHRPNGENYPAGEINALWAGEIRRALSEMPAGAKYLVYGGFLHGLDAPDRVPAILGIPALLPANSNDFPDDYFDWEPRYAVVARSHGIRSAVQTLSFEKECAVEARSDRRGGAERAAAFAKLCPAIAAHRAGDRSARARIAEIGAQLRTNGAGPWDRRYLDELSRKLAER